MVLPVILTLSKVYMRRMTVAGGDPKEGGRLGL